MTTIANQDQRQDQSGGTNAGSYIIKFSIKLSFQRNTSQTTRSVAADCRRHQHGYKYIVLEAPTGFGKSPVAIAVGRTLGTSYICSATKDLQTQVHQRLSILEGHQGNGKL